MKVLNRALYRSKLGFDVTMKDIDEVLDAGELEIAVAGGRWWTARRNGRTKRWKRDPSRIRVPIKYGLYGYAAIEEQDFI